VFAAGRERAPEGEATPRRDGLQGEREEGVFEQGQEMNERGEAFTE